MLPASVRPSLRVVRWSSWAPSRFSSSCTLRLTVVLGRRSARAAPTKLPSSTTLTKTRVSLRSRDIGSLLGMAGRISPATGQLFPDLPANQVPRRALVCAPRIDRSSRDLPPRRHPLPRPRRPGWRRGTRLFGGNRAAGRAGPGPGRRRADGLAAPVRGRPAAAVAADGAGAPATIPDLGEKVPWPGQSVPLPPSRYAMNLRKLPAAGKAAMRSGTPWPWLLSGSALPLAIALAVALGGCTSNAQEGPQRPPPPAVSVATVLSKPVHQWDTFNGRVAAPESVELRPRVSGYVQRVAFEEGQEVEKGDLLFEIDPRPYRAALDQARAQLERARAEAKLAKAQDARAQMLIEAKAIS